MDILESIPVYLVNGILVTAEFLWSHLAAALVVALASIWLLLIERGLIADAEVVARPDRPGAAHVARRVSRFPLVIAATAAVASVIAAEMYPLPVPQLLVAVWGIALFLVLALPSGRWESVPGARGFLLAYPLLLLGFRFALTLTEASDPYAWARAVGGLDEGQQVVAQGRGLILTVFTWLAWLGVPAALIAYAFGRLSAVGYSLVDPRASAAEIVRAIRARGGAI